VTRRASCASSPGSTRRGACRRRWQRGGGHLSRQGALQAHLRDELGLDQRRLARPFQAACGVGGVVLDRRGAAVARGRAGPGLGANRHDRGRHPHRARRPGDLGARLGGAAPGRAGSASSSGAQSRWRSPRASARWSGRPPDAPGLGGWAHVPPAVQPRRDVTHDVSRRTVGAEREMTVAGHLVERGPGRGQPGGDLGGWRRDSRPGSSSRARARRRASAAGTRHST
jgi:hypothetical protein